MSLPQFEQTIRLTMAVSADASSTKKLALPPVDPATVTFSTPSNSAKRSWNSNKADRSAVGVSMRASWVLSGAVECGDSPRAADSAAIAESSLSAST